MRQKFLLFIASVCITITISEIILRKKEVMGWQWPNSSYWYKTKWLEMHQNSGVQLTMNSIDTFNETYGWTLKPHLSGLLDYNYKVSSNSKSIRGKMEVVSGKQKHLRILMVGDSFIFGECVSDSETIGAFIEKEVPGCEVVNFGIHGWGLDQTLLRLENEAALYAPDIVIVGCFNDDLNRNHMWFRDYAKPYFVIENNELTLKGVPVKSPQKMLNSFHFKIADITIAKMDAIYNEVNRPSPDLLSEKIMDRLIVDIRKINAEPIMLYLPWRQECMSNNSQMDETFNAVSKRNGVILVNPVDILHNYLMQVKNPQSNFSCHYAPSLTGLIAKDISINLKKMKLP